jgi:hypothetical protein
LLPFPKRTFFAVSKVSLRAWVVLCDRIYAEPGHPEFIQFKQTEAIVITVGTSANN